MIPQGLRLYFHARGLKRKYFGYHEWPAVTFSQNRVYRMYRMLQNVTLQASCIHEVGDNRQLSAAWTRNIF